MATQGEIMNSNAGVRSAQAGDTPDATGLIKGLGWLGITLGVTELAIPETLATAIGVDRNGPAPAILRAMGVREIASGVAVLAKPEHTAPRWARIAGDLLDLGLLGLALSSRRSARSRLAIALGMVAGVTALDVLAVRRRGHARRVRPVIAVETINKPPREVYEFFRRFDQLPRFMDYLESVVPHANKRSTWTAKLPVGTVSWEAEIVEERPGEVLSWRSVEGSPIETRGRVTFTRAPGREMTEVRVELQLGAAGRTSTSLARLFARPQVKADLRRLKQVMETGEVLYSDSSVHRRPHPAQPSQPGARDHAPEIFVKNPPTATKGATR
jgi:uncharacterized membrane protein